ncbi:MAG: hypothetical protein AT710_05605 [Thermocladium sp. ECH_B]|nr:MAG: hypothetical protein AT710_05605 [Thermocladium sp. ECH_B]
MEELRTAWIQLFSIVIFSYKFLLHLGVAIDGTQSLKNMYVNGLLMCKILGLLLRGDSACS